MCRVPLREQGGQVGGVDLAGGEGDRPDAAERGDRRGGRGTAAAPGEGGRGSGCGSGCGGPGGPPARPLRFSPGCRCCVTGARSPTAASSLASPHPRGPCRPGTATCVLYTFVKYRSTSCRLAAADVRR